MEEQQEVIRRGSNEASAVRKAAVVVVVVRIRMKRSALKPHNETLISAVSRTTIFRTHSANFLLLLSAPISHQMHFTAGHHKNSHLVMGGKFFFVYFHPFRVPTHSTYRFSMVPFGLLLRP